MTTPWVFVFPGQGAQAVGMGQALAEAHPEAMAAWDEADSVLGLPLKHTAWNGPAEALTRTDLAQPALLTAGVAALRVVQGLGYSPAAAAGHSLGEYGALVASSALRFDDALRLVRTRGEAMQKAADASRGGMAAVIGADADALTALCAEIGGVAPANLNAPGQIVVSGTDEALDALEARAKEVKAKRVLRLNVAGAFHSPAMAPAAEAVRDALSGIAVSDPACPVYANVTARPETTAAEVRTNLVSQVAGQVRWEETVRNMAADGHTHYIELGCGAVLTGLIRRAAKGVEAHHVDSPDTLAAFQAVAS